MELKQLRYFLAIAEEKQITAAARRLHIAQPPLSYQLKRLEEELGVTLVRRGPRSLSLTDAGEMLRRRAEQILSLADSTRNEITSFGKEVRGTLSVGIISSSGGGIPDCRTLDFARQYPDVHFEIHEGNTYQVLDMLERGVAEVGIVRTPFPHEMLVYHYLPEEPMLAVMSPETLCGAEKRRVTLPELAGQPIVLYRRFDRLIREAFAHSGVEPQIICRSDDARTALRWAQAGLGIALVPESAFRMAEMEQLTAKELLCPELVTRMAVIWRKNRSLSVPAGKFVEFFS